MKPLTSIALILGALAFLAGCRPPGPAFRLSEAEAGFAPATFHVVEHRMRRAYSAGGVSAVSLTIHRGGRLVYQDNFGTVPHGGGEVAVTGETLFDVASLTKPLVGAPLAWKLLGEESLPEKDRALIAAITEGRSGAEDEALLPHVRSMMANGRLAPGPTILLARHWREAMHEAHSRAEGAWRYSNYSWAFLSVYPLVEPAAGRALQGHDPLWLSREFTFRPGAGRVVAPSGWRGMEPLQGRPYDPFADYLVTEWNIPPAHSGLFASSTAIARAVDGLLDGRGGRAAFARWFFEQADPRLLAGDSTRRMHQLRGGLRSAAGTPFAPEGARHGRYYHMEGYTGCLLWVDLQTRTVVVLLSNATMDEDRGPWERLSRDIIRTIQRGGAG